ncbi:MAG: RNA polymerase sigma factor SigZ [Deltaproteobacteria bacterium]|nr:RNA polymerase sigma factor SigZ [Deltaproteobacteria bacterium]
MQGTQGKPPWSKFTSFLRAFIKKRVSDNAAVDDILQNVFLKIHSKMASLKDQTRFESWVFEIVRNSIADYYRNNQRSEALNDDLDSFESALPEPEAEQRLALSLRQIVEKLPEPYRTALIVTDLDGMSQKDLARKLEISESGAKSRVQRAREKLKNELLACCHFELDRNGRILDYWEHCCRCCREKRR